MSGATSQQAASAADRFSAAHAALKADPTVQFTLRRAPPPIGTRITFRHRGITGGGVPRFATYWRLAGPA